MTLDKNDHPPPSPNPAKDVPDQANGFQELYSSIRSNKSLKSKASGNSIRYNLDQEIRHPEAMSTLVELLTETSQASVHDILNDGEEDQMFITGYEKSAFLSFFCYIGFFLTLGILRLVMHWWQHWLLLATHRKCSLEIAQKVLVRERYQGTHDAFYVRNIITMDSESIK